jgi:NhaP-type Na+/H+ or K+/H+ antiporter
MIPERPAGDGGGGPRYPPRRETPAGRMPPGIRPALLIFGIAALLEYGAIWRVDRTGDPRFLWLGVLVAAATFAVAVLAGRRLPKGQRWPFWLAGLACVAAGLILLGYTCAQALSGI